MLLLLLDRKEKIDQGGHLLLSLYETLEVLDFNPNDIYCSFKPKRDGTISIAKELKSPISRAGKQKRTTTYHTKVMHTKMQ